MPISHRAGNTKAAEHLTALWVASKDAFVPQPFSGNTWHQWHFCTKHNSLTQRTAVPSDSFAKSFRMIPEVFNPSLSSLLSLHLILSLIFLSSCPSLPLPYTLPSPCTFPLYLPLIPSPYLPFPPFISSLSSSFVRCNGALWALFVDGPMLHFLGYDSWSTGRASQKLSKIERRELIKRNKM